MLYAGPVIALGMAGVLSAVLAWAFSPRRRQAHANRDRTFGTLLPVASLPDERGAQQLRTVLAAAGVRATVARQPASGQVRVDPDGHVLREERPWLVLVFPADLDRAHAALP